MNFIFWQLVILALFYQANAKISLRKGWRRPVLKLPPVKFHFKQRSQLEPVIKSINQTLDHFSTSTDPQTFLQRYGENLQFYNGSGPMIVFISGESSLYNEISYLYTGLAYDLANQTGAALYMLEHRYYGESYPNGSYNSRTYLKVNQAIADIVYFIQLKKTADPGLGKVVVVGGSYTASLAAWARQAYPLDIDAAISASGIFNIKINSFEYFEIVQKSVQQYSGCIDVIKSGYKAVKKYLRTYWGIQQVQKEFGISLPIWFTLISPSFKKYIIDNIVITPVALTVQYDQMDKNISDMCANLTANNGLSNSQKLANYYNVFYNTSALADNTTATYPSATSDGISWGYQVCTEVGNFITTTSKNGPFYNEEPLWYFYYNCAQNVNLFSPILIQFNNPKLSKAYGGLNMNVTKVVFTAGTEDPWSGIGMTSDLNAEAPVITVEGSSHCAVLAPASTVNSTALTNARNRVISLVKQWIQ